MLRKYAAFILALGFVLAGCAESAPSPVEVEENPYGSFPVDPPAVDDTVLTLRADGSTDLSLADLRAMPAVQITIVEPFVQEELTFQGVELQYVLQGAAISSASRIETEALNDYIYADSASALIDAGAILAYSEGGNPIPMDEGGPIRLVFAEDSSYFSNLDAWNWSLRTIRETPE